MQKAADLDQVSPGTLGGDVSLNSHEIRMCDTMQFWGFGVQITVEVALGRRLRWAEPMSVFEEFQLPNSTEFSKRRPRLRVSFQ